MNTKHILEDYGFEEWTNTEQEYTVSKKKVKSSAMAIKQKREEDAKLAENNYDAMVANKEMFLNRGRYAKKLD